MGGLKFLIAQIQALDLEIAHLDPLRSHKDTAARATCEVSRPLDTAVVFACWLVESNADPGARRTRDFGYGPDVRDCAAAGIGGREEAAAALESDAFWLC
jgi:hypothetical protein